MPALQGERGEHELNKSLLLALSLTEWRVRDVWLQVEPGKMLLLYTPPGQDRDIPEELDDESKSLGELGVLSGGTIVVDEIAA